MGEVSNLLAGLSQFAPGSSGQARQVALLTEEVIPSAMPARFGLDSSPDLASRAEDVKQAAAELNTAWLKAHQDSGEHKDRNPDARYSAAITCLWHTLDALRSAVDRLDDADFSRFQAIQQSRWAAFALVGVNWVLILFAFGYGVQLHRQFRKEARIRFNVELELAAERAALEKRVKVRTAALEAEVTERQRAERLNSGRNRTLEMLARNESTSEILQALADTVAEYRSTWLCLFHSVEEGSLKLVASSGLNNKLIQHLRSISTGFAGAPESVALASGSPMWFSTSARNTCRGANCCAPMGCSQRGLRHFSRLKLALLELSRSIRC
jgi:metal-responsive CopG/Arc/MetJ family transcriptional regulator